MHNNPVIIFGANGLGKAAFEIFRSHNVEVYGFLDDDKELHGQEIDETTVLGKTKDDGFLKLIGKKCDAFVASDDNAERRSLTEMLNTRRKVMPVNAVHSGATLAPTATLKHGTLINSGAQIGAFASIGNHCLVHTGAIVDYEATLGDFVQVGAGSIVNSQVTIGEGAFIGSGATIVANVTIGAGARVGAGSLVIQDVPDNTTVFGVPAKAVDA